MLRQPGRVGETSHPATTTYQQSPVWESAEQKEERLSRRRSLEQQRGRDRHATEVMEERVEHLSRRRGVQRQHEKDQSATGTEVGSLTATNGITHPK